MLKLDRYIRPISLAQAYEQMQLPGHILLAGTTLSQLRPCNAVVGIELADLLPDNIYQKDNMIHIGAMAKLSEIVVNPLFSEKMSMALQKTIQHLQGPALRNLITAGGSAAARFPQSEWITVLLVCRAKLRLYKSGEMALSDYFKQNENDIICEIILENNQKIGYYAVRENWTDQPLLCAAVCGEEENCRIAIGARPFLAEAELYPMDMTAEEMAERFMKIHRFGSDLHASEHYRRAICAAVLKRAMEEMKTCG